ncbi:hypothetical protein [Orenia marismortui]|uniref:hypothetical protein n=1 Tax=Orenia marismortui TaxID=46469 RepID=UPI00037E5574|nr:hypothetical protein [Orenia marismortui]
MSFFPNFYHGDTDIRDDLKLEHDRYHVYLNGKFVGDKVLLGESDSIFDLNNYLKRQGFNDFISDLEGDHFLIESKNSDSYTLMKRDLEGHLSIR